MKSILVLKPTINPLEKRFCQNCGTDISHKHKNAKFCCHSCCDAYHESLGKPTHVTWHDQIVEGNRTRTNNYLTNTIGEQR